MFTVAHPTEREHVHTSDRLDHQTVAVGQDADGHGLHDEVVNGFIYDAATRLIDGIARRILRELSRPVEVNGVEIEIAASIVAIAPPDADIDVLLASTDAAMYEAKRAGGAAHRIALVD